MSRSYLDKDVINAARTAIKNDVTSFEIHAVDAIAKDRSGAYGIMSYIRAYVEALERYGGVERIFGNYELHTLVYKYFHMHFKFPCDEKIKKTEGGIWIHT